MTRIILLGFMGTGKSTIGRALSVKLNIPFYDSDVEIEKSENKTITKIFDLFGEEYFREKEKDVIEQLKSKDNFVLSTGGGLPCFNDLMNELNELGTTVYLKASPKFLFSRLKANKKERPLLVDLNDEQLLAYIEQKLSDREEYYNQAQLIVNTIDLTADKLIHHLHLHQKN